MFRALISVSDKTGLSDFARGLVRLFGNDLMIISTGGTYRDLKGSQIPVTKIESITGVPEVMDGRVKTINPKIAGGILADRQKPEHMRQLVEVLHSCEIHLVVVNLYPFAATAARPGVTFADLVENIDIGGPTLVRAAAKNFRHVLVATSPGQYGDVLSQLRQRGGPTLRFRFELMYAAMRHTGDYDTAIANEMARWQPVDFHFEYRPAQVCE